MLENLYLGHTNFNINLIISNQIKDSKFCNYTKTWPSYFLISVPLDINLKV